jgi:Na+/serine symporter
LEDHDEITAFFRVNDSPVGASLLAMVVNDNAGNLTPRGVLGFIASKLAPTGIEFTRAYLALLLKPYRTVGASLLAMVVNDNAGNLAPRGVPEFIASKLAPTR